MRRWSQAFHYGAGGRTRDDGHKLKQENFRPDVRRKIPPLRTSGDQVRWRKRVPREVGQSSSFRVFQDMAG